MISQIIWCQTLGNSYACRSSKNTVNKELMFTSVHLNITLNPTANTLERTLLKAIKEGAMEEIIRKFLFTYRTTSYPMMDGKSPAEQLIGRTVRTINSAMLLKDKTNESAKSQKEVCLLSAISFLLLISERVTSGRLKLWSKNGKKSSMKSR
ncbi:hypothetical protein ACTXT7_007444 [Hymenolepis weldensis]